MHLPTRAQRKCSAIIAATFALLLGSTCSPSAQTASSGAAPAEAAQRAGRHFAVQVGSYELEANARKVAQEYVAKGYAARTSRAHDHENRNWFVVRIGDYPSKAAARSAADEIAQGATNAVMVVSRTGSAAAEHGPSSPSASSIPAAAPVVIAEVAQPAQAPGAENGASERPQAAPVETAPTPAPIALPMPVAAPAAPVVAPSSAPPADKQTSDAARAAPGATRPAEPPDIAKITRRGSLVVGMTAFDSPPFYMVRGGKLIGIDIEMAEGLAKALGVGVTYNRSAATFNDVVDLVIKGDADIAISKLSRTMARAKRIRYSSAYVQLRHALLFNRLRLAQYARGREIVDVLQHFDTSLSVIGNSSFVDFAKQRFPNAKVDQRPNWDEIVEAVVKGEVLVAYRDELEVKRISIERPDSSLQVRTVVMTDATDSIAMAVAWDSQHLLSFANLFIENMPQKPTADALLDRYKSYLVPTPTN
jgi:ABC-type amino acid transport substrate-binding protein